MNGGPLWTWAVMNVGRYERGPLWTWAVMNVGRYERGPLWMWSVVRYECGPLWMWSVMNVVSYECGQLWMWSVMNVVCYEWGLWWMGSVMCAFVMNVVCNVRVCYERSKWWTKVNHSTIQLKPKNAGQTSNAEVSLRLLCLMLVNQINNSILNAKCRRCNNFK